MSEKEGSKKQEAKKPAPRRRFPEDDFNSFNKTYRQLLSRGKHKV